MQVRRFSGPCEAEQRLAWERCGWCGKGICGLPLDATWALALWPRARPDRFALGRLVRRVHRPRRIHLPETEPAPKAAKPIPNFRRSIRTGHITRPHSDWDPIPPFASPTHPLRHLFPCYLKSRPTIEHKANTPASQSQSNEIFPSPPSTPFAYAPLPSTPLPKPWLRAAQLSPTRMVERRLPRMNLRRRHPIASASTSPVSRRRTWPAITQSRFPRRRSIINLVRMAQLRHQRGEETSM